jgi:transcriptional regulator with XRE-family HTH domain
MTFRDDRLRDILKAKGLSEPSDLHHRTGIPYQQIARYLKRRGTSGSGVPSVDTLAVMVVKLELDANYLLGTDDRYEEMQPLQAAAHMSLDRYLERRNRQAKPVTSADASELRYVASHSAKPPLWIADWESHHERMTVSAEARPESLQPEPPRHLRRQKRLRS